MENASKALIIAGSILIALLLVSVGIMLFNGSTGLFNSAKSKMTDQEKSLFNSTFTAYEGKNISGTSVKELLRTVVVNNDDKENNPHITINGNDSFTQTSIGSTEIKNVAKYEVKVDMSGGVVNNITVNGGGITNTGGSGESGV